MRKLKRCNFLRVTSLSCTSHSSKGFTYSETWLSLTVPFCVASLFFSSLSLGFLQFSFSSFPFIYFFISVVVSSSHRLTDDHFSSTFFIHVVDLTMDPTQLRVSVTKQQKGNVTDIDEEVPILSIALFHSQNSNK